ncbi:type II secretion system F family protein [Telluria mixta]|uniref:Type II secretion system F family protein n=1 Tax=Telluria mixta TaxID=34071 RepID=A0ABT2BSQ1_9BURK|nr:type II secretion system F family protein [Telluria mixta]MCS0628022.1 type II secretion system F family protein [Telluria mixta]WEM93861.1 type II secretion system F family protein [Telluria mixta]
MIIVLLLVFLAVILLVEGAWLLWRARHGAAAVRLQRRLDLVARKSDATPLRPLLKSRRMGELSALARTLSGVVLAVRLNGLIAQAGLHWSISRLLLVSGAAGAAGLAAGMLGAQPFIVCIVLAGLLATLPWAWVTWKRRRRLRRLEQQLPEALDLIGRAVRAGHSLPLGIQLLAEEMPDPIAAEFRLVHEQVSFGVSLQQALTGLCERVPLTDYRYFAVAVLVQRQSGGNLTEVLGNLSKLIRERLKLLTRIRILTSEGRMSAWTLALLPFVLGALLFYVNPTFMQPLWLDPIGRGMLRVLLSMMVLGIIVLSRITKIHV